FIMFFHIFFFFFFSSRRRHTRSYGDWSSDVCSSDLFAAHLLSSPISPLELIMAKVLHCNDLVPGCRFEARGICEEEVIAEFANRSEERRAGKECRSRWWTWE